MKTNQANHDYRRIPIIIPHKKPLCLNCGGTIVPIPPSGHRACPDCGSTQFTMVMEDEAEEFRARLRAKNPLLVRREVILHDLQYEPLSPEEGRELLSELGEIMTALQKDNYDATVSIEAGKVQRRFDWNEMKETKI